MSIGLVVSIIGIGIALVIGYLVIFQVLEAIPLNEADAETNDSIDSAKSIIYAAFGLAAVGLIVLVAFSLIAVFRA